LSYAEGKINQTVFNRFFMDNLFYCVTITLKSTFFLAIWPQIDFTGTIKPPERCSQTKIALTSNHFPSDRQAIMAFPDGYLAVRLYKNRVWLYHILPRFLYEIIISMWKVVCESFIFM